MLELMGGDFSESIVMVLSGHVKNGTIIFDQTVTLPDGLPVRVEVTENVTYPSYSDAPSETAGRRLLKYAGKAVGLPPDAARNHDHYLHGTAKR
jgi:hypothetical protein